jgi:2-desacetyl-2-hydroxyethyl bacteriochlorophyllide A dehydrogenase
LWSGPEKFFDILLASTDKGIVMKAIVIEAPKQVRLVEAALPILKPDEVLVRSRAAGICGSDVELYRGTRPQGFYRYPLIPGHEWSGEVAELGERVCGLSAGERVVVEGFLSCGTCHNCRSGLNNLCQAGYDEIGFTRPGGLAEYVAVPARQVHVLPPDASFQEAALLEPAAVVAQGFLQVKPRAAETIVVIGDGTIGLLAVQIASLFSPTALFLAGSHDERLAVGQQLGATHTINSNRDDPVQLLHDATGGSGADLVFEGGSRAAGVEIAIRLAKRGGTIILEGIAGSGTQLSLESDIFVLKHLTLQGIFGASSAAWTYAVQLFNSGHLHLAQLISHRFALPDYLEALDTVMNRYKGAPKVLLVHDESGGKL